MQNEPILPADFPLLADPELDVGKRGARFGGRGRDHQVLHRVLTSRRVAVGLLSAHDIKAMVTELNAEGGPASSWQHGLSKPLLAGVQRLDVSRSKNNGASFAAAAVGSGRRSGVVRDGNSCPGGAAPRPDGRDLGAR